MVDYAELYETDDDFDETDDDFDEAYDDFDETDDDFDEDYDDLLESLEDIDIEDAEILGTLLNPVGSVLGRIGSNLFGGKSKRSRPRIRRYPRGIPRSRGGVSPIFSRRGLATTAMVNKVQAALNRRIGSNSRGISVLNKRANVINKRINNTERRLTREVGRLRNADKRQVRGIRANTRRASKLGKELDSVRQTSLLMSLFTGGEKDYEVIGEPEIETTIELETQTDSSGNVTLVPVQKERLKSIKLEPKGGGSDDLLPLLLLGGGLGGGKGGIDPILLLLLMKD